MYHRNVHWACNKPVEFTIKRQILFVFAVLFYVFVKEKTLYKMAKGLHIEEIEQLLATKSALKTADFFTVMPDCPAPTVYSRIRSLVQKGRLQAIGHGMYLVGARPEYKEFVLDGRSQPVLD